MKVKSARLADTGAVNERSARIDEIEQEKMELKEEMEKIMKEYAKITGYKALKRRRYKLGEAPNDWQKR